VSRVFYRDKRVKVGGRGREPACADVCTCPQALGSGGGHKALANHQTMQRLNPNNKGIHTAHGLPGEAGHLGHLDTHVMGACTDVPATAPQQGRFCPCAGQSPATPLPILRLAVCVERRDSCASSARSGSERCVIGFLCGVSSCARVRAC